MSTHRIDLRAVRSALSLTCLPTRAGRPAPYEVRRWCAVSTSRANTYSRNGPHPSYYRPPVFAWGRVRLVYVNAMRERHEAPTPCDCAPHDLARASAARIAAGLSPITSPN